MTDGVWTLVRFLHVLGAATWVGGTIVLGAVAVPVARATTGPDGGRELLTRLARRFGAVAALAWLVILGSGFGLLHHRGLTMGDLPDSEYGQRLLTKISLLGAMGVIALLHAFWQGPRVRRLEQAGDPSRARRWKIVGGVFDGLILLMSLAALWLAVSLVP